MHPTPERMVKNVSWCPEMPRDSENKNTRFKVLHVERNNRFDYNN